jgi:hypothetical protein
MELTIAMARNGYILRDSEGQVTVVANNDPATATWEMLGEVLEQIGHIGSRYDEWRVRVIMEHGDHWISPEEAEAIRGDD